MKKNHDPETNATRISLFVILNEFNINIAEPYAPKVSILKFELKTSGQELSWEFSVNSTLHAQLHHERTNPVERGSVMRKNAFKR